MFKDERILAFQNYHFNSTFLFLIYMSVFFTFILQANFMTETLEQQFDLVRNETNTSHVLQFGDMVSILHS